jgi:hypothetical protein
MEKVGARGRSRESELANFVLFPDAVQHEAKRSGAPQSRDRYKRRSLERSRLKSAFTRVFDALWPGQVCPYFFAGQYFWKYFASGGGWFFWIGIT